MTERTRESVPADAASPDRSRRRKLGELLIAAVAIAGSILIAVGVYFYNDQIRQLGVLGYPGIFLINLLSSATLFAIAPGFVAVIALGGTLNPVLVGLFAGAGAAVGETTGYLAGVGGKAILEDKPIYAAFHRWIERYGPFAILVMAALPNPLFDVGGLIAGATGMPLWQFMLATWIGKSIRFTVLAFFGDALSVGGAPR